MAATINKWRVTPQARGVKQGFKIANQHLGSPWLDACVEQPYYSGSLI